MATFTRGALLDLLFTAAITTGAIGTGREPAHIALQGSGSVDPLSFQIVWPPLRIVPYDPADHKLPRSIFLVLSMPSKVSEGRHSPKLSRFNLRLHGFRGPGEGSAQVLPADDK